MSLNAQQLINPHFVGPDYIRAIAKLSNEEIARKRGNALYKIAGAIERAAPAIVSEFRKYAARLLGDKLPLELVYITDNGHTGATEQPVADQAADEVRGRLNTIARSFEILSGDKPNITIRYQDVASQDTLGGAAALRQAVIGEVPVFGRFIFLNVAPRKEERGKKSDNGGETVYVGVHRNGTFFGGTGPHCFSLFKKEIETGELVVVKANVATSGSQFRSRDFFPWLSYIATLHLPTYAHLAGDSLNTEQQQAILKGFNFVDSAAVLSARDIPDVPNNGAVATSIDVHGNIKTGLTGADLDKTYPKGGEVYVLINGKLLEAEIAGASFEKSEGRVVLSRGSTYRDALDLVNDQSAAVEIFKIGGRVADVAEVGAPHLRRGLEFHVFDAALLKNVTTRVNADKSNGSVLEMGEIAQALVAQGLVQGLDNSRLKEAYDGDKPFLATRSGVSVSASTAPARSPS